MTKQTKLPTLTAMTLSIFLVAVPLGTVLAEATAPTQAPAPAPAPAPEKPMMQGGKEAMMPGQPGGMGMMRSPEMMQQRRAMMIKRREMMQQHMAKVEGYLANIESLLRELVEQNKAKK